MSEPMVTVLGEAQLECPPDLASFIVTVVRSADSADRVRSALATASEQVRALLAGFAPLLERTSTTDIHFAPVFGRRGQGKVQGYRGTFSTEITVHDLSSLSEVVLGLAPVTDSHFDGPSWTLRRDNPVHRQVRLAAIEDARQRADDYAAAFGAAVVRLVEVSDTQARSFLHPQAGRAENFRSAAAADEPSEFAFEPTPQTVSGQVTVRFSLSEPQLA